MAINYIKEINNKGVALSISYKFLKMRINYTEWGLTLH